MGSIKDTTKGNIFFFDADDPRLKLITDPGHRDYDIRVELPINESMVDSILRKGILQPIVVRKCGDFFNVVIGRQRVKNAREAQTRTDNAIKIPCRTMTMSDYESLEYSVIENVQRVDDSPAVRGRNALRMMENGASEEGICKTFGVKIETINNWITIWKSCDSVKEALENGDITVSQALTVARAPDGELNTRLDDAKKVGKKRAGRPKGPSRKKIKIIATELEEGGFELEISKCSDTELLVIQEALDMEMSRRRSE